MTNHSEIAAIVYRFPEINNNTQTFIKVRVGIKLKQ